MTPRQARRERRAAERKTRKAEIRRAKADVLTNEDTAITEAAATRDTGFVSQDIAREDVNPNDWPESAPRRHFPNDLPKEVPPAQFESLSDNASTRARRAEINRANAQLSSGPRTTAGKSTSSRNATKHGLASSQPIIPGEDPAAFDTLLADLMRDHQPANRTEELLVNQMAQSYWLEQRAIRLQNGCFTDIGVDHQGLSLFLRYGTTHHRAFHKALADLQRMQKERRKGERILQSPEPGFVSQKTAKSIAATGFVSQNALKNNASNEFLQQNDPSTNLGPGFVSQTTPAEVSERSHTVSKAA
jgi:hypothetical protein